MLPRDRILAAAARQPGQLPFTWSLGMTGEFSAQARIELARRGINWDVIVDEVEDVTTLWPSYHGPIGTRDSAGYVRMWGITTTATSYGAGHYDEFTGNPLRGMESPDELDRVPWPDPDDYEYASLAGQLAAADPNGERALRIWGGNVYEIYQWMTGLEESLTNLLTAPELVVAALERITTHFEGKFQRTVAALTRQPDLVFVADDLGSQQSLLMSPQTYRKILQPFHHRLFSHIKSLCPQTKVLYHSDGAVFDIVPDLIDSGIEILEAVQVDAAGMDPARLKAAYGKKIAFNGGISVQSLLPYGTVQQVKDGVKHLIDTLGAGGGYIAAPSHGVQAGTPVDNVLAMLETALGEERYGAALEKASRPRP